LIVACGCYNPSLGNPGFYCHAGDNPACPDGQQCVNGRCTSKQRVVIPDGGGTDGPMNNFDFGGTPHDFAQPNNPPDFSRPPPTMTGCYGLLMCINNCPATDMTCPMTCQSNATANGNALLQSLISCIFTACPMTNPTDPCFDTSSAQCSQCVSAAQDPTLNGQCVSQVNACDADLP
jgi:hypothetical protein